jgi:hypothetical protein
MMLADISGMANTRLAKIVVKGASLKRKGAEAGQRESRTTSTNSLVGQKWRWGDEELIPSPSIDETHPKI